MRAAMGLLLANAYEKDRSESYLDRIEMRIRRDRVRLKVLGEQIAREKSRCKKEDELGGFRQWSVK